MKRIAFARLIIIVALLTNGHLYAQTEIGMQLYTYRNEIPKDVAGTLKKIAALPVKELEGGDTYGMSKEAYKKLLDDAGFQMIGVGASFEELEKAPAAVAEKAIFFGAKYVICYWVPHNGDTFTLADAKKAAAVFNAAGKALKARGLSFAYHAHGYEFQTYGNGTFFDYLMKALDPRYANFQMDVFWFHHSGQNPVQWLERYPKRFVSLHLKDRKRGTEGNITGEADVETNVVLGTGDVPIAAIMKAAKAAGIRHYFIEDESSQAVVQVPLSIDYLKGLE